MVQLINAGLVLFVQVTTEYADHPKSYLLTPSRKKVRKLVTRGSKITIVDQFFKDLQLRKHMAAKIGRIVQDEISVMCSNKFSSVLQNHSIHSFSCEGVLAEMEACAPTLLSILRMCTSAPKRPRKGKRQKHRKTINKPIPDASAAISVCAAILCRHRRPSMSLLQRVVSLVLYEGHSSKQVC